jgi:hypothetical protein
MPRGDGTGPPKGGGQCVRPGCGHKAPHVRNTNDQRLRLTSNEQGDQLCQVEMEQALLEWVQ